MWAPVPALKTPCGGGCGVAICPGLGLLVTSNKMDNTLSVFSLPGPGLTGAGAGAGVGVGVGAAGLALVCTLGGAASAPPMQFAFSDASGAPRSGYLAFAGAPTSRRLLVTDAGHDAVHVIDVTGRVHAGYVAAPGSIPGPRGVAASGCRVAVSTCSAGTGRVVVFEGSGATWAQVGVVGGGSGHSSGVDGGLFQPYGLRFTGDGTGLVVADYEAGSVAHFRVADGSLVRRLALGLNGPSDVEELEGGWLVACGSSHTVEFVGDGAGSMRRRSCLGKQGSGDGDLSWPRALALVPGVGLVVREDGYWFANQRLQVFSAPDAVHPAAVPSAGAVGDGDGRRQRVVAALAEKGAPRVSSVVSTATATSVQQVRTRPVVSVEKCLCFMLDSPLPLLEYCRTTFCDLR
jgi:hypothetical protein